MRSSQKNIVIFILLFSAFSALKINAQQLAPGKYWLRLSDKYNNAYSISNPEDFLSQRAIDRRLRHGIEITEEDLPVTDTYIDSLKQLGLYILGQSKWFNAVLVESTDTALLDTISSLGFIRDFSPENREWRQVNNKTGIKSYTKDKIAEPLLIEDKYGAASKQTELLNGITFHNLGYKGAGIHIAVIDGGFSGVDTLAAFRTLRDENRLLGTRDFVEPGTGQLFTISGHGTSVLSTMAADIPGYILGTAPEASYWLLRSEDTRSEYKVEEAYWTMAAEFADSAGVDIMNSSLGYNLFHDSLMNYSTSDLDGKKSLVTRAADKAFDKGILVVISAGNSGNSSWSKITPPADGVNVLSVGAIDTTGLIALFSSLGPTTDGRIKPEVVSVGFKTAIVNRFGNVSSGYGTSYASPQIAGMTACLLQAIPEKTNKELLEAIKRSASMYESPDTIYGYGIPNFMNALWLLKNQNIEDDENSISVYPNPFHDILEIKLGEKIETIKQIHFFNIEGKLITSKYGKWKAGEIIIFNETNMPGPGVYFVVLRSANKDYVKKLVKHQQSP